MWHGPKIAWSPTRGRLLDGCTRQYVLQHVLSQKSSEIRRASRLRPLKDHARRGLRDAILEMLDSWSMDEEPDELELRSIIHRSMLSAIVAGEAKEEDPHSEVDGLTNLMIHRLNLIRRAPVISRLKSLNPGLWQSVDRLQPLLLDGARQYGAPDLIIWNGDRLTMVRLAMEMNSREPKASNLLELGSMILWAKRNPLIPISSEQMDVVRIGWLGTRWVKWQRPVSEQWAKESRTLIAMDIEQMAHLMIFNGDIDDLPRSKSRWKCNNCSFAEECPGLIKASKQGHSMQIQDH